MAYAHSQQSALSWTHTWTQQMLLASLAHTDFIVHRKVNKRVGLTAADRQRLQRAPHLVECVQLNSPCRQWLLLLHILHALAVEHQIRPLEPFPPAPSS